MALTIRSAQDHRLDREAGAIVYPVISRRARGLSIGINLFSDKKTCSFDCPYCEVFPFTSDIQFSLPALERGLREFAVALNMDGSQGLRSRSVFSPSETSTDLNVKDLSFSGNGEPTLHPAFRPALELAGQLRNELYSQAKLVLITNGTGLLNPETADFLAIAARGAMEPFSGTGKELEIWLKVDAGTEAWYRKINRSAISFESLCRAIEDFAGRAPFVIQTMVCKIGGQPAPQEEVRAWENLVRRLVELSGTVPPPRPGPQRLQLYGKARPAPEDPLAEPVDEAYLLERRASLIRKLEPYTIPVEVFV
ncbi:hypothetical protein [Gracilinema caldarium]|uniref:hypothetical protein n=1 Tax=Gracilinema caldarium TaxID=215591 RepID=UPI0026EBA6C9|nr:hypothetical protein [Gracilinema caldarium]